MVSSRAYDHLHVSRIRLRSGETHALRGAPDTVRIAFGLGSAALLRDGTRTALLPADAVCVTRGDLTVEVRAGADGELLLLSAPADTLGANRHAILDGLGRVWHADTGTGRLVAGLLTALAGEMDHLVSGNSGRLAHHLIGLIGVMCADATAPGAERDSEVTLAQVKHYIEDHLGDVEMTSDTIAAAHFISTRTLRRLFEADGETVSGYIRQRRMEQCRIDLLDAASAGVPVAMIGARWGMWDAAHFSRLFKSSFGVSPRALRSAQRATRHPDADLALAAHG